MFFGSWSMIHEQFVEYLLVQVVHKVVRLADLHGEVSVLGHKGIKAVLEHFLGRFGHARDVDIGFERRFVEQLHGALADVHGQVSHALQVGDDLDGCGHEPQIASRRLPDGEETDALFLDLDVEVIDDGVAVDHLERQVPVPIHQRLDGFPDRVLDGPSHLEDMFL